MILLGLGCCNSGCFQVPSPHHCFIGITNQQTRGDTQAASGMRWAEAALWALRERSSTHCTLLHHPCHIDVRKTTEIVSRVWVHPTKSRRYRMSARAPSQVGYIELDFPAQVEYLHSFLPFLPLPPQLFATNTMKIFASLLLLGGACMPALSWVIPDAETAQQIFGGQSLRNSPSSTPSPSTLTGAQEIFEDLKEQQAEGRLEGIVEELQNVFSTHNNPFEALFESGPNEDLEFWDTDAWLGHEENVAARGLFGTIGKKYHKHHDHGRPHLGDGGGGGGGGHPHHGSDPGYGNGNPYRGTGPSVSPLSRWKKSMIQSTDSNLRLQW